MSRMSAKNIVRGEEVQAAIQPYVPSLMGNLTPTVASHKTVSERQLFGFGNL